MSEPIQPPSHLSASADDVEDNTIMPPPINAEETHPLVVPQGAPVDVADEKHVDEAEHADDAKDAVVAPVVVVNTPKVSCDRDYVGVSSSVSDGWSCGGRTNRTRSTSRSSSSPVRRTCTRLNQKLPSVEW
jgi:hypothetical protein